MSAREVVADGFRTIRSAGACDEGCDCERSEYDASADRILAALADAGWSVVKLPTRRIERAVGPGGYVAVIEEAVGWNRCLDAIERLTREGSE